MATRAVTDEMMQSIANAIRLKTGGASPMTVEQMPLQIGLIPTDGKNGVYVETITGDGTYTFTVPSHGLTSLTAIIIIASDMVTTAENQRIQFAEYVPVASGHVASNRTGRVLTQKSDGTWDYWDFSLNLEFGENITATASSVRPLATGIEYTIIYM